MPDASGAMPIHWAAPRVLLVEDDDALRELIASALRNDGFEVTEAATGADMLDELADTLLHGAPLAFDLIVADVRLPLVTGLEILAGLRDIGCLVPYVVMTAFADASTYLAANRCEATRVFDKPFSLDDLRSVVRAHTRWRSPTPARTNRLREELS